MILYLWLGVAIALAIGTEILKSKMMRRRAPGTPILSPFWWGRGFTILTSPNSFTEAGQFYRLWTIRAEVTLTVWCFPIGFIVFMIDQAGRGHL